MSTEKTTSKIDKILDELNCYEKDLLYRKLWSHYVESDVRSEHSNLSQEEVNKVVERVVYEGDMDCNLSYWDNISNIVNELKQEVK